MKEKFKTLKIIHFGICAGVALAYIIVGDLHTLEFLKLPEFNSGTNILLSIPLGALLVGEKLFKSQLKSIDPNISAEDKIAPYQTASLIRWAVIEGAAFIILFMAKELIVVGILLILYLMYLRPTQDRMLRDLANAGV
ncbi:MFS transporter [Flagellimonas sp. GZD32]|uniref:MFS transporter n=1 Tax=Flagellimonas cixiensis TaxID=3228750 RepID=UPI0035C8BC35